MGNTSGGVVRASPVDPADHGQDDGSRSVEGRWTPRRFPAQRSAATCRLPPPLTSASNCVDCTRMRPTSAIHNRRSTDVSLPPGATPTPGVRGEATWDSWVAEKTSSSPWPERLRMPRSSRLFPFSKLYGCKFAPGSCATAELCRSPRPSKASAGLLLHGNRNRSDLPAPVHNGERHCRAGGRVFGDLNVELPNTP